eukprot:3659737-Pleurochrysis_carterae.AAC.1
MNAVTTDLDNTPTPPSDYWQADLLGVIPPTLSAHAAWTNDCDHVDVCIVVTLTVANLHHFVSALTCESVKSHDT